MNLNADTPLLYGLRDILALKVPKFGCGLSQCGACTLHGDGVVPSAPLTPAAQQPAATLSALQGCALPALVPMGEAICR